MPQDPSIDDALAFIVDFAANPRTDGYSSYGYELYLSNVIVAFMREMEDDQSHSPHSSRRAEELSAIFYEAAWTLCRYGVLRPGIKRLGLQATADGASGNGYSLTSAGRQWLSEGADQLVVLQPSRLNQLFASLADGLGGGFLQRSQEAVRCHASHAYLACCAMCGAAAESILLAVAIAKSGNEDSVLAQYRSASGRKRVTEMVVGQLPVGIATPFRSAASLLGYWRDTAAHGLESNISEIEAHDALARLLRFAQFVTDNWSELTAPN